MSLSTFSTQNDKKAIESTTSSIRDLCHSRSSFFYWYHVRCSLSSGLALLGGESKQKETVGLSLVEDCLEDAFPLPLEEVGGRRTDPVGLRSTEGGCDGVVWLKEG